ncbi:lipase family protein [Nocardia cyriacigeorgica]|uniref:lipase family protein n=1 Tax=Nocardia cyriacigeorgica TaxID=135487 RepID=UPI00189363EC|nr:lipase family protein [Nocardia cyriacigeorgica]MBF6415377.1 lipase [Nocardia cyriacigeorgica]
MRSRARSLIAALASALAVGAGAISAPHAWTQPVTEIAGADFYVPPAPLPGGPGTIVRAEPSHLALSMGAMPATSTRVMYTSSDTHGAPAAATGTFLMPAVPWTGPGPRPLVAYAGGTKGQGDQCAPSKLLAQFIHFEPPVNLIFEYDVVALYSLLSRGMAVVMTDYQGLGTPAVHGFLNRKEQAHAVLDSARAALRLPGTGLAPDSPVILYGYSQGGMASAGAAELHPSYAPDLNVRGAYVGGPVVDDQYFVGYNDGRAAAAPTHAWILNGMAASYPQVRPVLDAELNDTGKAILRDSESKCAMPVGMAQNHPHTAQWTSSGQPLIAVIDRNPVLRAAFAEQRVGSLTPSAPVLIASAKNDEGAPFPPIHATAADWCGGGAAVQLEANSSIPPMTGLAGTHVLAFFPALDASQQWITDRLAGRPAPSNCGALP